MVQCTSTRGVTCVENKERFEVVYSQGIVTRTEIWVDRETGVHYMFHRDGNSGGMTVLLDQDGKPVIAKQ